MKRADVRQKAFAMPVNNPAYPPGPYKFYNREFIIISYRTDPDRLRAARSLSASWPMTAIDPPGDRS